MSDDVAPAEHPLGVLTTAERNSWAETRKHLENIGNAASLNIIDTSLFAVALDDPISEVPKDICKWFLHSDGVNRCDFVCFDFFSCSIYYNRNYITSICREYLQMV